MRYFAILPLMSAVTALGFALPMPDPDVEIVGKVLLTEKVSDITVSQEKQGLEFHFGKLTDEEKKQKVGWELWRAQIQVQTVHFPTNSAQTNLTSPVAVYYEVDWSTNFMTLYSIDSQYPPRRSFKTNDVIHLYGFQARWPEIETNGYHINNQTSSVFPTTIVR